MLAFIRHGWRSWKSAKAVAFLAITALAAGIGSATAIYTVVDAVLLKPVEWRQGDRFVTLFSAQTDDPGRWSATSWPGLLEYRERMRSFDVFGIFETREFSLTAPGDPQHLKGVEVTPELPVALGVNPLMGRWFRDDAGNPAVISSVLWKRLGGRPDILGQLLTLDGKQYTVTGVMPAAFRFPLGTVFSGEFRTDVWLPLNPQGARKAAGFGNYFCYARLRPGVTVAQADADAKRVAAQMVRENPRENRTYTALVLNLRDSIVKEIRPTLLLLFGAAGALLLITCANVAGLLLARSVTRAKETAIRVALGAARWQLGLQYFTEGLLVALAGAAGGVLVSAGLVRLVLRMAGDNIPLADSIGVDWRAFVFAFVAAVVSALLFSLAPLWQAVRTHPNEALSDGVRASAPARSRRLSRWLVVGEIGLAFTLLSVSAVLLSQLDRLLRTPAGFDSGHLLTLRFNADDAAYPQKGQLAAYQARLLRAVERVPGVGSAALAHNVPLDGCCISTGLLPEGSPADPNSSQSVNLIVVTPRYFRTMGIPFKRGRVFEESDNGDVPVPNAVIDEAAAKLYWPRGDALGAYARLGTDGSRVRVIGIVGDVRNRGLGDDNMPELYLEYAPGLPGLSAMMVRSPLPPAALIPAVRGAIRAVNPQQPLYDVRTMGEIILESLTTQRLQSMLTAFFGFAALLMAALGVYGVVSYAVRHRTVEIGTRMALGAGSRDVLGLVLGDGLKMTAMGIALGAVAVTAAVFLLRSEVFGIHVDDPRPFLYSTGLVAGFTALACFFPGWRATLVSPMVAIRDDPGSILRGLAERVSGFISREDETADFSDAGLLEEFIESSSHAASYGEAIANALAAVRGKIGCESAVLLTREAGAYRGASSICSLPFGGLLAGRLRSYSLPLPLTRGDFETWRRWAASENPAHLAEIECLGAAGVAMAVPLLAKSEIAGILLLGAPVGREEYGAGEKRVLRTCAGQFALMIENARLTDRIVEQEKVTRDLLLAAEVQKRLFPDKPPPTDAFTLAGVSIPARGVGGDYYDFLPLDRDRIGIALADVAGKGIAAALIMSVVQASLRILATEGDISLADLAAKMNRYLHRSTGTNAYATFFYAQLDGRKRELRYVNAGHNPPYLLRYVAPRAIEELPAGGTVIGLFPQMSYLEATVELQPGDVLIAFTDGVPEALNPADEEFGEERVRNLLGECAHLTVDEIASRISGELKTWIGNAVQYDDLTFILVKVAA